MHSFGSAPDVSSQIIERRMRLWNALNRGELLRPAAGTVGQYRFITLARDEGSHGDAIAEGLAQRLSWHVFDRELVNYIAENGHVRETLVRQLDERSLNLLQDAVLRLLRMPEYRSFGVNEYHQALLKTLAFIAAQGGAILVGRGANFALHGDVHGLKVRITASPDTRAARLADLWKVPPGEARRRMEAMDAERRNFVRQHYAHDYDDLRFYDLILNTDLLSVGQTVSMIQAAMGQAKAAGH